MKKLQIFALLITTTFLSIGSKEVEGTPILERKFGGRAGRSIISRGDNIPDFSIRKDSANFLLIYLHENKSIADFKRDTRLDDETVNNTVELLISKNWLKERNGKLIPTVFIATAEDGKRLFHYAQPISEQIADEIEKVLPHIKAEFANTDMAKKQNFEHWSFLILSNVLLDSWVIFDVERNFLKCPDGKEYSRPLRHGKNYYASIMEQTEKDREPFGIYGNGITSWTEEREVSVYGNNRFSTDCYRNLQSSKNTISVDDDWILQKMARGFFLPKLLKILEYNREYIEEVYRKTGYSETISFGEFFIWWYHFIYTQATNEMNDRGILTIPASGNFDFERLFINR